MTPTEAKRIFERAVARLLADDLAADMPQGFPNTVGERPLAFRLALYMAEGGAEVDGLRVDCDYNRHGTSVKVFLASKVEGEEPEEPAQRRFFPDIVLHRRGDDSANILVCEIKRVGDRRDPDIDRGRLIALTRRGGGFCYKLGAFVQIDQNAPRISVEYFAEGRPVGQQICPEDFR